jgi:DNA-binding response OmpR family regulator
MHVLVVDDDAAARSGLEKLLKLEGADVALAKDGVDALDEVMSDEPDVVLTDLSMPRMDGISLCERLHEIDPELPVILATAFGDTDNIVAGFRAGAVDFFTKPLNFDAVRASVRRAVRAAHKRRKQSVRAAREEALETGRALLSAAHAHALIDQILDRLRAGHASLDFRPHDARRLMLEASALGPLAVQRSLTLEINTPADELLVLCDRERVLPGLISMFTNAMRFAPAGSVVSLALDRVEDGAAFSITVDATCAAAFELLLLDLRDLVLSHAGRAWVASGAFGTTLSLFLRETSRAS